MIQITEEIIKNIKKLEDLNSYISVIVDYKKEEEYTNLFTELHRSIEEINPEFTPGDISAIWGAVEGYTKEMYLYTYSDILEMFYGGNKILKASLEWLDVKTRVAFLLANGKLAENSYLNDLLVNINDNYIASPIKLEYSSAKLEKETYHILTA